MTTDQIRNALRAQPFRPFRLHLADGRSFEIRHAEFMALSPGGRIVIVFAQADACEIIDLLLVTSLEILESAGTPRKRAR